MNALDEARVRSELHQAVDVLDPLPPPFAAVIAKGRRRRRTRLVVGGLTLAAAAAAAVVAVVVIAPGGGTQTVRTASQPPALRPYARQNGGVPVKHSKESLDWVAGPVTTPAGRYGAFVTKRDLVLVKVVKGRWQTEAKVALGEGPPTLRLGVQAGPTLPSGIPTFISRGEGGDVSYYGAVATDLGGRWQYARFGSCGKADCGNNINEASYLRMAGSRLVSEQNDCSPYCAAGTEYRIRWQWDESKQRFEAASVTAIKP
ncbi:MAG TPA: hypothetical protein VHW92_05560 [Mycobacteriales bacterium]|jgi:hypothetical protein|nr:hypothetical protein [Mycobacteriales bacterium]